MTRWYYLENKHRRGPVSARQLIELAEFGRITPQTLIAKEGTSKWVRARKVRGLFDSVREQEVAGSGVAGKAAAPRPPRTTPPPPPTAPPVDRDDPLAALAAAAAGDDPAAELAQTVAQQDATDAPPAPPPPPRRTSRKSRTRRSKAAGKTKRHAAAAAMDLSRVRPAGFWLRAVAAIIDGIVLNFVFIPLGFLNQFIVARLTVQAAETEQFDPVLPTLVVIGFGVLSIIIGLLYFAMFEASKQQGTPGKIMLDLRVVDMKGRRISVQHALGRNAAKFISNLTLNIGYIIAAFTRKKQALHDIMAGCLVIRR